ncbi:hypothetical protein VNO80_08684 [Phaseolus coccineus]|uniref:Uncharacterized protein n=1 Tax=Phaseolus coccineus TaxID=3886 RepID=A0AAN9N5C0_PHACN
MSAPFASSTAIFFCFLSSFFFFFFSTFASARLPFQVHFHRTNSNSLSNTPNQSPNPNPNQWKPKPQPLRSTTRPSKPLPFPVFRLDHPIPRHPLPLSSRLDSWKPRPRAHDFDPLPRAGVRHVARGWTRFGVVEPTLFRRRGMGRHRSLSHPHQHINHAPTGFVRRIRKFLNRF